MADAHGGHIRWLDGLKGLACLAVVWHHFLLRYFPATYYGGEGGGAVLSQLPFWVVTNANFLLLLFFFCSGFVLPLQKKPARLWTLPVRRYLRLAPPLWLCCAATYLLYKVGLLTGFDFGPAGAPGLRNLAACGLWRILILGDTTYSGAFWMLGQLFLAGLAAQLLCSCMAEGTLRRVLLAVGGGVCYLFLSTYCAAVFWGALTCSLLHTGPGQRLSARPAALLLLIPGLFLGGYPSGRAPDNLYAALWRPAVLPAGTTSALTFQLAGVILVFLALWCCPRLQKLPASRPAVALGRLSYCVYVLHILAICQLSDLLYAPLSGLLGPTGGALALLILLHPALLSAALLCEKICTAFSRRVGLLLHL